MPGRKAKGNVSKALLLTHATKIQNIKGFLLSTDAFDWVAWEFMMAVCRHFGLVPHMLSWISTLYQNPSVRLKINGTLSIKVHITNGTRQGCPLSPFLFILSIEPLILTIGTNSAISGFKVQDREFKIAAYADDLLFFLTNMTITLPNLLKEFKHYGYISNLKINYTKSEALNISLPDKILTLTKTNSQFRWDPNALKYLGTWITPQLQSTFEKNYPPLLRNCERDLKNWNMGFFFIVWTHSNH